MRALVASFVAASLAAAGARADATETAALFHLERGVAAFKAGDFVEARRELTIAHELAPDRANPYRWLALTAVQLGDCPGARDNASGFLARVPADDPRAAELVRLRDLCTRGGVVRHDAGPVDDEARPAPREAARPVYARWWFWTAVAGAAAIATTAIVLSVGDDAPAMLPGIRCDTTGCHL